MLPLFGYFLFDQSKNIAVLKPRAGYLRSLLFFKAKDLSFQAKAKDFKMCPRGQEPPRRLHLWSVGFASIAWKFFIFLFLKNNLTLGLFWW